jgi:nucleoside-diphosphate-sugar epimerase
MHVLVTGAAGFVGVNLVRALAEHGARVTALARRPPDGAILDFVGDDLERVRWVRGDVTDRDAMRRIVADGVRQIVHAAAVTATRDEERAATARVFDVNAGGTLSLLEAARQAGVGRFVLVSSGGLYGPAPPLPALDESTPMGATNLYGIAKAASERLVLRYADLHGFSGVVGRLGTAYGPMERPSGSRHTLSAVQQAISAFVDPTRGGDPVRVRRSDVARDFLHIDDATDAFVRLATAPDLAHDIYNVGAPQAAPMSEALDALTGATGRPWREVGEDEDADVIQTAASARAAMDTGRLERDLGWRMRHDLADGSRATLAWVLRWAESHPAWFEGRT